jgi:hypothetical protein
MASSPINYLNMLVFLKDVPLTPWNNGNVMRRGRCYSAHKWSTGKSFSKIHSNRLGLAAGYTVPSMEYPCLIPFEVAERTVEGHLGIASVTLGLCFVSSGGQVKPLQDDAV